MIKFTLMIISIAVSLLAFRSINYLSDKQSPKEKFDIASFNKFQVNGTAKFRSKDGSEITLKTLGPEYFEKVKRDSNSPFALVLRFFRPSLMLNSSVHTFYEFSYGKLLLYDETGNLVRERNLDTPYGLDIKSFIDVVSKDLNINLLIPTPGLVVYRNIAAENMPEYEIVISIHDLTYRHIILDGNSGVVKKDYIATNIEY